MSKFVDYCVMLLDCPPEEEQILDSTLDSMHELSADTAENQGKFFSFPIEPKCHGPSMIEVDGDFELAVFSHTDSKTELTYNVYNLLHRKKFFTVNSVPLRTELIHKLNKINGALHEFYFVVSVSSGQIALKSYSHRAWTKKQAAVKNYLSLQAMRASAIMKIYLSQILRITNAEHLIEADQTPDSELALLIEFIQTNHAVLDEDLDQDPRPELNALIEETGQIQIPTAEPLPGCALSSADVFSEIYIYNSSRLRWPLFDYGGFSVVHKDEVEFEYLEPGVHGSQNIEASLPKKKMYNPQRVQKCALIKKQPLRNYEHKAKREKELLRLLSDKSCPYLLSFYETVQDDRFRGSLFSKFCHFKSFNCYMYFFSLSMSLANKLRILLEIMLGLLFLKRNGIIHLDIKPDNVLISKGLQCKISDFGEAYHETLKGYKVTGYTVPYVPPELLDTKPSFSNQMDVFSFGMMLLEVICQQCPIYSKKPALKAQISKAYRERDYLRYVCVQPERIRKVGYWQVIDVLRETGMRCLLPNTKERPTHQSIVVVLRRLLSFMEKQL